MAENNRPKKNITGSYPGVTGAYHSPKKEKREFSSPDVSSGADTRPRVNIDVTKRKVQGDQGSGTRVNIDLTKTSEVPKVDGGTRVINVKPTDTDGATRVDIDIKNNTRRTGRADGATRIDMDTVKRKSSPPKSETVRSKDEPKQGFDFKMWFSSDNMKKFLVQLRFYGIIVIVSLLLTFGIVNVANDVFAFIKPDESIIVNIPQGGSTMTVAKALEKAGVIDHAYVFRLYSKLKHADGTFQYGDYTLNSNLGYDQIIAKLKKVSVQAETVTLTIAAGSSQDEIVQMLTSNEYFNATDLDYALNEYEYENYPWVQELPDRRCRLEGYLVAGDYEISVGSSAVSFVEQMLKRFTETVLSEANAPLITASGLTADEVVTLASLIQAECGSADMYKGAAAVLFNRLRAETPVNLQLTSPINYVLSQPKTQLTENDKRTESDYNTYLHAGLPTGPVCNPSIEAVNAVLAPEASSFMYFISDGTTAYYAVTADEHAANLQKASATAKGTDTIR